jgi:diguanylate cyclase (GGDEF)-like protein
VETAGPGGRQQAGFRYLDVSRPTAAYEVAQADLDAYVAHRVGLVREGDTTALDLRRSSGEVIRVQCAALPDGGRMLSYTVVTDIVRHADELEVLRNALDNIQDGVLLLDANLNAQFLNQKVRAYWGVSEAKAASHPSYAKLIAEAPHAGSRGLTLEQRDAFFASRVEAIRTAEPKVRDTQLADGRHIRVRCTVTPNGGRMLTYGDVTDLVRNAELLEKLATVDSMTGLYNRRHFLTLAEAEWVRFQRYQRPLSVLMIDIDHFKSVNDRYGHAVGDQAIASVATACQQSKRNSDIVGRLGGEEFAVLLPETDSAQAAIVAGRILERVAGQILPVHDLQFKLTISVGTASATSSMSGVDALLRAADEAMYRAKAGGRNRMIQWSSPEMEAPPLVAE